MPLPLPLGSVKLWQMPEGLLYQTLHFKNQQGGVAFSPNGNQLACGSYGDGMISVFDVSTGMLVKEMTQPQFSDGHFYVSALTYSADGEQLASAQFAMETGAVDCPIN